MWNLVEIVKVGQKGLCIVSGPVYVGFYIYLFIYKPFWVGVLFQGILVPASDSSFALFAHHLDSAKNMNTWTGRN